MCEFRVRFTSATVWIGYQSERQRSCKTSWHRHNGWYMTFYSALGCGGGRRAGFGQTHKILQKYDKMSTMGLANEGGGAIMFAVRSSRLAPYWRLFMVR
ncbi:MAG: hypothetical protein Q4E17_07185 [Synergistes sp.]|nr:hypothetical protein [Synergistes sp.]